MDDLRVEDIQGVIDQGVGQCNELGIRRVSLHSLKQFLSVPLTMLGVEHSLEVPKKIDEGNDLQVFVFLLQDVDRLGGDASLAMRPWGRWIGEPVLEVQPNRVEPTLMGQIAKASKVAERRRLLARNVIHPHPEAHSARVYPTITVYRGTI